MCASTHNFRELAMERVHEATGCIGLAASLTVKAQAALTKYSQLMWRVDNFSKHYDLARKGRVPVIYSPPFWSHRHGYKMCAVLAPFGEGQKYVAMFIALLRDENDAILEWPFKCPITISWVNQDGSGMHSNFCYDMPTFGEEEGTIVPRAIPDNDAFLGRPRAERNPAFGIQRFAKLSEIFAGKFIVNNTAFIKVYVDVREVAII